MAPFDFQSRTRLIFGEGSIDRLGDLASELGFRRTLLVADHGILACGYVDRATKLLSDAGISVFTFHDFDSNPNSTMMEAGRAFASAVGVDSLIGLGGRVADGEGTLRGGGPAHDPFLTALRPRVLRQLRLADVPVIAVSVVILAVIRTDMTLLNLNPNFATSAQGIILIGVVMVGTFLQLRRARR